MIRNISWQQKINLQYIIDIALKNAIRKAALFLRKKELEEPDYIAAVTLYFTSEFSDILKIFFANHSFSITGVFCHQKPLAKMTGELKSCEIGDLLFVYIYKDIWGRKYYNSLLFQAKKLTSEILKLSVENDLRQFRLYSEWPEFKYSRAGELNKIKRDIQPKIFTNGAKYLLIDPDYDIYYRNNPCEYIFGTAPAHHPLHLDNQLSLELIDFICFKAGRTFEERSYDLDIKDDTWTKDEWSKLIWDMLNITKRSISRRRNICLDEFPRTTEFDNNLYLTQYGGDLSSTLFGDISNIKRDNNYEEYLNEESSGLSMIVMECQDSEENYYHK